MYYLLPLFTAIIWGGSSIVNKLAASAIEPSAISFYRWGVAMIILTPFCLFSVIKSRRIIRPYLPKLAFLALLGMVINQSLGYYAGLTTSASNMSLIYSLVPLISVFLSLPLLGTPISPLSIIGAVLSLTGLAFMLGYGDITFFLHQSIAQGDALQVIAAFAYAFYCVLLKRWKMPISNWQMIYMQGLFAVVMLIPLWLTSERILPTRSSIPLIMYAAIGASIVAPWMWIKSIDVIGTEASAMFINLVPIVTVLIAAIFLGDKIESYHIIGGVLVISGAILAQIKTKKTKAKILSNYDLK